MARLRFGSAAALLVALAVAPAAATDLGARLEAEARWGIRTGGGDVALARFTALPSIRPALGGALAIDVRARLEFAPDQTGLGTRDTYAPWSRPVALMEGGRLELDRAVIQLRSGATRVTIGKQAVAWGVLDGVQVADRFDPIRRREWVATDLRPERIGRWAARLETQLAGLRLDAAFAPDPTVNQQASPGDAFAVRAPRFRAGLPGSAPTLPFVSDRRDRAFADATYGLRAAATVGRLDLSALAMRGPEPDPLLLAAATEAGPAIRLAYPQRTVIAASFVLPAGATVWRLEAAHSPDQPLNLDAMQVGRPEIVRRPRTTVGLGLDWQGPARLFVNGQLVVDHVAPTGPALARPATDVVATFRVHRDLAQDRIRLRGEVLADARKGDMLLRPAVEWKVDDRLALIAGADIFTGASDGLFGQFRQESRLWFNARASF